MKTPPPFANPAQLSGQSSDKRAVTTLFPRLGPHIIMAQGQLRDSRSLPVSLDEAAHPCRVPPAISRGAVLSPQVAPGSRPVCPFFTWPHFPGWPRWSRSRPGSVFSDILLETWLETCGRGADIYTTDIGKHCKLRKALSMMF